ncbi:MAG: 50S ribosomal protein L18 [Euryarchaeota archaeon]|nr:50S ribosomal protein L18 [Euryarchaeota archaeon]|tara:strand:+ start:219 stop:734 length:516 start_codon:yes stop_codon:yes gene_type:complete
MAKGPRQRTSFRRRESGETDYRRRLKLLRSREMRAVVRVSNTRVTCQLVDWKSDGDRVILSCTGSDLVKRHGWPEDMSQKSVPASYLTGYALGKAAVTAGHDSAVLDIGLSASTSGSRVFAALKGMVDAGMEIPHGDEIFPSDERIEGNHIDDKISKSVESTRKKIEEAYQ